VSLVERVMVERVMVESLSRSSRGSYRTSIEVSLNEFPIE
jgi:hypothetical protein